MEYIQQQLYDFYKDMGFIIVEEHEVSKETNFKGMVNTLKMSHKECEGSYILVKEGIHIISNVCDNWSADIIFLVHSLDDFLTSHSIVHEIEVPKSESDIADKVIFEFKVFSKASGWLKLGTCQLIDGCIVAIKNINIENLFNSL